MVSVRPLVQIVRIELRKGQGKMASSITQLPMKTTNTQEFYTERVRVEMGEEGKKKRRGTRRNR